jgi:CheY-like chemotaxis protein
MADDNDGTGRPVVAIINTAEETAQLLQELLDDEGFAPVAAYVVDFKLGRQNLKAFFAAHQPQAVIYDIALPYEENWNFFCAHVLGAQFLPPERFVLTTVNKNVLDQLIGPNPSIELVGRPYDLEAILRALKRALAQ